MTYLGPPLLFPWIALGARAGWRPWKFQVLGFFFASFNEPMGVIAVVTAGLVIVTQALRRGPGARALHFAVGAILGLGLMAAAPGNTERVAQLHAKPSLLRAIPAAFEMAIAHAHTFFAQDLLAWMSALALGVGFLMAIPGKPPKLPLAPRKLWAGVLAWLGAQFALWFVFFLPSAYVWGRIPPS